LDVSDVHRRLLEYGFNGVLWLPHDAIAKSMQTGRSVLEQFVSLGHRPRVLPKLSVQDGIQACRAHISHHHTRWSHKGCGEGLEALRQYQRQFNDKTGTFSQAPDHNWASHYADGFRYSTLAIRPPKAPAKPVPLVAPWKPPVMTLEALFDANKRSPAYDRV
jgi:phage terminase large subunit